MHSMKHILTRCAANAGIVLFLAFAACVFSIGSPLHAEPSNAGGFKRPGLDSKLEATIDAFGVSVPAILDRGDVPGAAIALVDDRGVLWTQGFGQTGGRGKRSVTPDTPFLICGLSKLITATTVMIAVQDGLVSLDEPITTYLPDFAINSRYEEHPERTEQLLWHEGWGFGFTTMLHWYPEHRIGVVVLTNKLPHPVLSDLGLVPDG